MNELHPTLMTVTVADRGHVPFLDEPASLAAINHVLSACDAGKLVSGFRQNDGW
jgi:hypothetical protein